MINRSEEVYSRGSDLLLDCVSLAVRLNPYTSGVLQIGGMWKWPISKKRKVENEDLLNREFRLCPESGILASSRVETRFSGISIERPPWKPHIHSSLFYNYLLIMKFVNIY